MAKPAKKDGAGLVVAGYICAILALFIFPLGLGLAGIIIGIINIFKGRPGHGIAQIILAATFGAIGSFIGAALFVIGAALS